MSNGHARFSPSAAYRNSSCVGSLKIVEEAYKLGLVKTSSYADWGTACHEYAAEALAVLFNRQPYDFNKIIDPEKREVVQAYCGFVGSIFSNFRKNHKGVQYFIEQKVSYDGDFWGTADLLLTGVHSTTKDFEVVLIDLKAGAGVEVSAEENEQLLSYIVCAQSQMKRKIDKAHGFIFQPRTPGKEFSRWTIDQEVIAIATESLRRNKEASIDHADNGVLGEKCKSGDWCRFCPGKEFKDGKPLCDAYANNANGSALKILDKVPEVPTFDVLTAQQKFEIFKRRKLIKKILDDACKDVLALALKEKFEGYKVVQKAGRRSWRDGDLEAMGKMLMEKGIEQPFKKSLIPFGQVEKQLGKNSIDNMLQPGKTSYELVPDEDERNAIQNVSIEELGEIDFDE